MSYAVAAIAAGDARNAGPGARTLFARGSGARQPADRHHRLRCELSGVGSAEFQFGAPASGPAPQPLVSG